LSNLLTGLSDADWDRPSRCDGWSVADVVLHLAQTNEMAIASARGRFADVMSGMRAESIDAGADLMVARDRGEPVATTRARWDASVDNLRAALDACDPHDRVDWVVGQLSAQTLATTRLAETWIHTGDVAAAFGILPAPTDRLWHIARLAWRTLPYAFARAGESLTGPVRFDLRSPSGDSWDFAPEGEPINTIRGDAVEVCLLAARRLSPSETALEADGPDARRVLELVRTYA
jgi:uncharacterized protein (TIGR03084 family)